MRQRWLGTILFAILALSLLALARRPAQAPAAAAPFAPLDEIVEGGIKRGIYPGAVIVVGRRGSVLYSRGYGHLTWDPKSPVPTPDSTIWDLASLTKVTATTPAVMRLVEQGRVDLDRPVATYLPRFTGGRKAEVTVRMLLDHTSGLRSYVQFFRLAPTRDSAIALLYAEPLRRPPGKSAEYSDLNFLLLGLLVDRVAGESLDRFATREVFVPAGMLRTMFTPPRALHESVVPTGVWHGHPSRGVVNDQNAVRFGEVAGHAGLFSTGTDLGRYARLWLSEGTVGDRRVFESGTIRRFLQPGASSGNRLLGWERRDPPGKDPVAAGTLLTDSTYGHTGWTGTELWLDPVRDLYLIFLTNRAYDPRVGRSISELRAVRARLADAAVRAVPGACSDRIQPSC
jgi:CubicO group peptidase (beta-lactamase class C family)